MTVSFLSLTKTKRGHTINQERLRERERERESSRWQEQQQPFTSSYIVDHEIKPPPSLTSSLSPPPFPSSSLSPPPFPSSSLSPPPLSHLVDPYKISSSLGSSPFTLSLLPCPSLSLCVCERLSLSLSGVVVGCCSLVVLSIRRFRHFL